MSTETASKLNRQSSQLPLNWAAKIQETVPKNSMEPCSEPVIAVVGVPDLNRALLQNSKIPINEAVQSTSPEVVFAKSPSEPGEPAESIVRGPKSQAQFDRKARERAQSENPKNRVLDDVAQSMMEMLARQIQTPTTVSPKPVADISDPDWSEEKNTQVVERPAVADVEELSIETELEIDEQAIKTLADQILKRYSSGTTCFIGFVGCESNPHVEETCALVAKEIAARELGQVLLIDADFERRKLSEACQKSTASGLQNLLMRSTLDVESSLLRAGEVSLDFMPAGNVNVKYWLRANERANELFERIKPAYRVVCLSLGNAHNRSTQMLSSICDGVYLLVSMTESSQIVAQSATQQLHTANANIMGCVVSECPAEVA